MLNKDVATISRPWLCYPQRLIEEHMAFGLGTSSFREQIKHLWRSLQRDAWQTWESSRDYLDNSNKIAIILERHETDWMKAKELTHYPQNDWWVKATGRKESSDLTREIDCIQKKVDANQKFVVGAGAVLATLVAVMQVVPPMVVVTTDVNNNGYNSNWYGEWFTWQQVRKFS